MKFRVTYYDDRDQEQTVVVEADNRHVARSCVPSDLVNRVEWAESDTPLTEWGDDGRPKETVYEEQDDQAGGEGDQPSSDQGQPPAPSGDGQEPNAGAPGTSEPPAPETPSTAAVTGVPSGSASTS